MEALNKRLTGDDTEFSEQYFVDCTFTYSGCAGGTANEGYKLTLMRQYMLSAADWPYTADCTSSKCVIIWILSINFSINFITALASTF